MDLHGEFEASRFFNQSRIDRRAADALVGLAAGMIADGTINQAEAEFLKDWLESNLAHLHDPVINLLYSRLSCMLQDGILDADESADLLSMLHSFAGLSPAKPKASYHAFTAPNDLPFCAPAPELSWDGRVFVFTGTMAYGPRKICQGLVEERGGKIGGSVNKKTHYLIVGSIGNEQWRHSSYGSKIIRAVELRESGCPLHIVGEDHWQQALFAPV